jgi:hypothetical protein
MASRAHIVSRLPPDSNVGTPLLSSFESAPSFSHESAGEVEMPADCTHREAVGHLGGLYPPK